MGLFDRWRRPVSSAVQPEPAPEKPRLIVVGADATIDEKKYIESFDSGRLTYSGEIGDLDYLSILQDKQENIQTLFQLADFYSDADTLVHSINYNVYVPFCSGSEWFLTDSKEKTIKLYEEYYKHIRLREKMVDIFVEFIKYNNVYCYILDGNLITLPVTKVRIANTLLSGQPVLEFDCQSIINELKYKGYDVNEKYAKDSQLDYILKGYPKEIQQAVKQGRQYAQLDPANTFTLQGPKEMWLRYAIPWITSAIEPLSRKQLIRNYERAMLNIASKPIMHVKYGDPKQDMLPDAQQLVAVRNIFKSAMRGLPLAVTNHLAQSSILQTDLSHMYEWPIYSGVNKEILTAGGVSDAIASGESDSGSTFSLGNLSKESAEFRISAMRDEFCDMMNKINIRLAQDIPGTYNLKEPPKFHFKPLDMSGRKALRETCFQLWEKGTVSTKTMMEMHGYDMDAEKAQREKEAGDGTDETLMDRATQATAKAAQSEPENSTKQRSVGRPKMDDSERNSSPDKAASGAAPKPSNPEGSNTE